MTLARFWLRLVCFVTITCMVLGLVCFILTPKYLYGICSMNNLYNQKRDSIDVLVLGTSLAYSGVNTNVLWAEYGIASYDLCSAEQPYWNSFYYLEETLKTQSPKLIVLDAKAASYPEDYTKRGRTVLNTYGIRSLCTRVRAITASTAPEDRLSFLLAFPEIHGNYAGLGGDALRMPAEATAEWKGFIGMEEHESHTRPSLVWTDTARPINARQQEYLEAIFDLAQTNGIPVLIVAFPYPDYASDHMFCNALWRIADRYGVPHLNYNDPAMRFGLAYTTDFADWQHLNTKGSVTFSRKLGADIQERFNIPDRRGDPAYASYDECLRQWLETWPDYEVGN